MSILAAGLAGFILTFPSAARGEPRETDDHFSSSGEVVTEPSDDSKRLREIAPLIVGPALGLAAAYGGQGLGALAGISLFTVASLSLTSPNPSPLSDYGWSGPLLLAMVIVPGMAHGLVAALAISGAIYFAFDDWITATVAFPVVFVLAPLSLPVGALLGACAGAVAGALLEAPGAQAGLWPPPMQRSGSGNWYIPIATALGFLFGSLFGGIAGTVFVGILPQIGFSTFAAYRFVGYPGVKSFQRWIVRQEWE